MEDGEKRFRFAWPEKNVTHTMRAREMALQYRAAAAAEHQRANALQQLLSEVDLRAVRLDNRKVADRLEKLLAELHVDPTGQLDDKFLEWGETWHLPEIPEDLKLDDDDWVPTWVVGRVLGISPTAVGNLRSQGVIDGEYMSYSDGYYYRVGEAKAIDFPGRGRIRAKRPGVKAKPVKKRK